MKKIKRGALAEKHINKFKELRRPTNFTPNYIVWECNLISGEFTLVSNTSPYSKPTLFDRTKFLDALHNGVRDYYKNVLGTFIRFLNSISSSSDISEYGLRLFVPIYLDYEELTYSIVQVQSMLGSCKQVTVVYITIIPLKEYDGEKIFFKTLKNDKRDEVARMFIVNNVNGYSIIGKVLTDRQLNIFKYACQGYSSNDIAKKLNTTKNNILKFNIRIKDSLSSFFEIEFESLQDTVNFYKSLFQN